MKVFYHKSDLDGWCSAAIVATRYTNCELIGMDYGEDFPWSALIRGEEVFMVDFSLQPWEDMLRLNDMVDLTWVDHHKSAIESYDAQPFEADEATVVLGRTEAACELCWDYLFLDVPMPKVVKLLGRYDVWDHQDDDVLPFQYGMRLWATDPAYSLQIWERVLFGDFPVEILLAGEVILSYVQRENEKYINATSFELEFEGLRFIASNAQLTGSKLFDAKWDPDQYDAMLVFGWRNRQWNISMYSDKEGVDVSKIAVKYGGGGHAGASGFQCDELPFELRG